MSVPALSDRVVPLAADPALVGRPGHLQNHGLGTMLNWNCSLVVPDYEEILVSRLGVLFVDVGGHQRVWTTQFHPRNAIIAHGHVYADSAT